MRGMGYLIDTGAARIPMGSTRNFIQILDSPLGHNRKRTGPKGMEFIGHTRVTTPRTDKRLTHFPIKSLGDTGTSAGEISPQLNGGKNPGGTLGGHIYMKYTGKPFL